MRHFHPTQFLCSALVPPLLLLSGCTALFSDDTDTLGTKASSAVSFDPFTEDLFRSEVSSNTINLHFTLSHPETFGITDVPITLGNISSESVSASRASLENVLFTLDHFDYDTLSADQQLTYDILSDYLQTELAVTDLTLYDEILRPSTGIQAQLPVLYEEYRFYGKEDIEDYLSLISLTDDYFSQIIEFEQEKANAGLFMSDYACDTIISQCEDFTENAEDHYLILTFDHKLDQMTELTDAEREAYKAQNADLVREHVLPAYDMLVSALTELLGSGSNNLGLCYFPEGKEYYEYLVYHSTGSSRSVQKLQELVQERRDEDLANAALLLLENPTLQEASGSALPAGMDSVTALRVLQEQMLQHFPAAPDTKFTVSYIDECMEDYMAPAFYITSPIDDYEQNSIFINASTDTSSMRYFTTLAHEGFPGHLYQTVMSYEAGLPPVRFILSFPGYVEGWATYVEMLSYHYAGLDDQVAELLALNQSALLSLYATTDLGIHYDGWSFADTLSFWKNYGITDQKALREVYELIVEEPAHYLKYYVGYLEFEALREKAKETFGPDYNDIAFHQAVLDIGPAPFAIVEKYLDQYYKGLSHNSDSPRPLINESPIPPRTATHNTLLKMPDPVLQLHFPAQAPPCNPREDRSSRRLCLRSDDTQAALRHSPR